MIPRHRGTRRTCGPTGIVGDLGAAKNPQRPTGPEDIRIPRDLGNPEQEPRTGGPRCGDLGTKDPEVGTEDRRSSAMDPSRRTEGARAWT